MTTDRQVAQPPTEREVNDLHTSGAEASIPVIAIDGPSGAGKGTVAAEIAGRLGWRLLDSGALYRVIGLTALRRGIDLHDSSALAVLPAELDIAFSNNAVFVDGIEETLAIRDDQVGTAASVVAAAPEVRAALLARQHGFRRAPGLVADGRDMGTVVFPDADVKIFLTASPQARAKRRFLQLQELHGTARRLNDDRAGGSVSRRSQPVTTDFDALEDALRRDIEARDARDRGRAVSPLVPAADAVTIDTTAMSVGDVVDAVMAHIGTSRERRGQIT